MKGIGKIVILAMLLVSIAVLAGCKDQDAPSNFEINLSFQLKDLNRYCANVPDIKGEWKAYDITIGGERYF